MPGDILHIPPPVPSLSVVVAPAQTCNVPVIVPGVPFTVTTTDALQPASEKHIVVAVPGDSAVTRPEVLPTVITPPLELQVHPGIDDVSVVVVPVHNPIDPVIEGTGLTVMVRDTLQLPME